MAFTSPQLLSKDSATDVDTNTTSFSVRFQDVDSSAFSVSGLTLPAAKVLKINHQDGKNGNVRSRVGIDRTEVDSLLVPATLSFYFVMDRPASTAITNAICIEVVNQLIDFLIEGGANANVTALLNREV